MIHTFTTFIKCYALIVFMITNDSLWSKNDRVKIKKLEFFSKCEIVLCAHLSAYSC